MVREEASDMEIRRPRLHVIRYAFASAIGLVVLVPHLSVATESPPQQSSHTGLIVASDVYVLATPFQSAATVVEAINRLPRPQAIGACCGGAWRVHFAALLLGPSGEETLDLQFYEVLSPDRSERPIHVFSSEVTTRPDDTIVSINDFVISTDLGFAAGHKYQVSLWRPGGSDRNPLAEGSFTLE